MAAIPDLGCADIVDLVGHLMSIEEPGRKSVGGTSAYTTNPTLFLRINASDPGPREIAWEEFRQCYAPMTPACPHLEAPGRSYSGCAAGLRFSNLRVRPGQGAISGISRSARFAQAHATWSNAA
jgi:hypothetical protein